MYWISLLVLSVCGCAYSQLTAQSSVAPELRECYTNATLVDRNNLPPATISVLIDIIRKIEDHPEVNVDMRQLAVLLLHSYRQDGIEYHQPETTVTANVLPFAPTFHSFHRHKLLLTKIIPGYSQILGNETIPSSLKCALHYMLSTTVDARVRGDENSCNQLSQYRASRTGRSIQDDVEIIDPNLLKNTNKNGQLRQYNPKSDVEYAYENNLKYERLLGDSQCPLLGGVVHTQWGAVSAGSLIAGIAAGAQPQTIPILELTKGSVLNYQNVQQTVTSIYPATLSGDLAEAVLIQGTNGLGSISVGTTGGWNSSQAHRYYMLQSRTNLEMTDPEIRGDLDGFHLGIRATSYNSVKLSQLIDMYYSPRNGALNPDVRACNRRELTQTYLSGTTLAGEAYAFAAALDTNMPLRGTITGGLDTLVSSAVTNFQNYITSNMNDVNCITTESTSRDYRVKTDLYIVLDSTWPYQAVYPAISYLLDVVEVSKYGSSVTLLSAFDGSTVVNKTYSIADFHTEYTHAKHQAIMTGVNLETTFTHVKERLLAELDHEKSINYVGGNSSVLLFLLNSGNLQNNERVYEQARIINETAPDTRILFATSTNQFDNLWNLVRNVHDDIITVALTTTGTNVETSMANVVNRILQTGRRIINPTCGSEYHGEITTGSRQFDDYVEPGYINFYAISPNYFYHNHDNRKLRINRASGGTGNLIVCHSRSVVQPRQNSSSLGVDENAITCETLTSGQIEISLANACDGYWTINSCPFFYLSVESSTGGTAATWTVCTENACRFPYNFKYQIAVEDLGCYSGTSNIIGSFTVIISILATSKLLF